MANKHHPATSKRSRKRIERGQRHKVKQCIKNQKFDNFLVNGGIKRKSKTKKKKKNGYLKCINCSRELTDRTVDKCVTCQIIEKGKDI